MSNMLQTVDMELEEASDCNIQVDKSAKRTKHYQSSPEMKDNNQLIAEIEELKQHIENRETSIIQLEQQVSELKNELASFKKPAVIIEVDNKLFIGNISPNVSWNDLEKEFSNYGTVKSVTIPVDRLSGRPRCFGFVTMETAKEAANAVERANGTLLDGRPIKVEISTGNKEITAIQAEVMQELIDELD